MKKIFILTILGCAFLCGNLWAGSYSMKESNQPKSDNTLTNGLMRGFANALFGWIEIPRCTVYYAQEYNVPGAILGPIQGAGMTIYRAFGGLTDILSLGFIKSGYTLYELANIPMFPWDAAWIYRPDN